MIIMLDFISSEYKKIIAGTSAIVLGALQIPQLASMLSMVTPYLIWIGGAAIVGGIWVLMSETK